MTKSQFENNIAPNTPELGMLFNSDFLTFRRKSIIYKKKLYIYMTFRIAQEYVLVIPRR